MDRLQRRGNLVYEYEVNDQVARRASYYAKFPLEKSGGKPLSSALGALLGQTDAPSHRNAKLWGAASRLAISWGQAMGSAREGNASHLETLLQADAFRVHTQRDGGWTLLMSAACEGNTPAVRILLEAGADPDARTEDGWTAAIGAAANGHMDTLQLLLDSGADAFAQMVDGWGLREACQCVPQLLAVLQRAQSIKPHNRCDALMAATRETQLALLERHGGARGLAEAHWSSTVRSLLASQKVLKQRSATAGWGREATQEEPAGRRVRVQGLITFTSLNGQTGRCSTSETAGRRMVRLDAPQWHSEDTKGGLVSLLTSCLVPIGASPAPTRKRQPASYQRSPRGEARPVPLCCRDATIG
ncbi:hypothetical protein CYMTET_27187 [Cymbomonas tetramitiformis]|uniref:Uncharacterized protein n=1 Tax=Cymbomonas tetramitiformis TaxID=36881 RepID=A0AAE0KX90_9CHLO|nr:hypothetical protein CYMTET_27187 [Cymbomonas tetramitiformis]